MMPASFRSVGMPSSVNNRALKELDPDHLVAGQVDLLVKRLDHGLAERDGRVRSGASFLKMIGTSVWSSSRVSASSNRSCRVVKGSTAPFVPKHFEVPGHRTVDSAAERQVHAHPLLGAVFMVLKAYRSD